MLRSTPNSSKGMYCMYSFYRKSDLHFFLFNHLHVSLAILSAWWMALKKKKKPIFINQKQTKQKKIWWLRKKAEQEMRIFKEKKEWQWKENIENLKVKMKRWRRQHTTRSWLRFVREGQLLEEAGSHLLVPLYVRHKCGRFLSISPTAITEPKKTMPCSLLACFMHKLPTINQSQACMRRW